MLYLPRNLVKSKRPAGNTYGYHVSLSALAGTEKPALAHLVQLLAKIKRDDVLRCVVQLLQLLDINRLRVVDFQIELASNFLSEERLTQLKAYATKDPGWAVFHHQAIWFVLQFAVVSCVDTGPQVDETQLRHSIGEAVLMANDLLAGDSFDFPAEGEKLDDEITAAFLPILEFSAAGLDIFGLSRFQKLWIDIPSSDLFKTKTLSITATNWHEVFEKHYGISLEDFGSICAICVSYFLPDEKNPKPRQLDIAKHFGNGRLRKRADAAFPLLAQTLDQLALNLINMPRQSWSRDFSPLRREPLLWLSPGVLACPQQSFLLDRLQDGVYWYLFDAYGVDSKYFQTCFGHAFEIYVEQQLDSFSYGGEVLSRSRFNSPKFEGTQDQVCDFYLDLGNAVSLWECKASLLTSYQKYSGSKEGLLNGIDSQSAMPKKGVGQLATSISRMINGATAVCDNHRIRWSSDTKVLPVLVTYEPLYSLHATRNRLQRKFNAFLQLETDRVLPVVVLTIDDLELLQGLTCQDSPKEVLLKYANHLDQNPNDRLGTFQGFLWDHYPKARIGADNEYREAAVKLMSKIAHDVQGLTALDDVSPLE